MGKPLELFALRVTAAVVGGFLLLVAVGAVTTFVHRRSVDDAPIVAPAGTVTQAPIHAGDAAPADPAIDSVLLESLRSAGPDGRLRRVRSYCGAGGELDRELELAVDGGAELTTLRAACEAAQAKRIADANASRLRLFRLTSNPLSTQPSSVQAPDNAEEHTTYEYTIPDAGHVIQWRTSATNWSLIVTNASSPFLFADDKDIRAFASYGPATWWRVTGGYFVGSFVLQSAGGIEVRSRANVCSAAPSEMLREVATECGH